MEHKLFEQMAAVEDRHWWFRARRDIIKHLIGNYIIPSPSNRILEVGCGTGGNLHTLRYFGSVEAFEPDAGARAIATRIGGFSILAGALPDALPDLRFKRYDLIALFDVIEHIDRDIESLQVIRNLLKPTGYIVLTVPAMPRLWSAHDIHHGHKRRYTQSSLAKTCRLAGFVIERIGYFNTLLFPLEASLRLLSRLTTIHRLSLRVPFSWLNAILHVTFAAERHLIDHIQLPFGLSLFAVLRAEHSTPFNVETTFPPQPSS